MKIAIDTTIANGYVKFGFVKGDFTYSAINYIIPVNDGTQLTAAAVNGNHVYINTAFSTYTVGQIYKYNGATWDLQTVSNTHRYIVKTRAITSVNYLFKGVDFTSSLGVNTIIEYWDISERAFGTRSQWLMIEPVNNMYVTLTSPSIVVKYSSTTSTWTTWTYNSSDITNSVYFPLKQVFVVQDPDNANRVYITKEGYAHFRQTHALTFLAQDVVDFSTTYGGSVTTLLNTLAGKLNGI